MPARTADNTGNLAFITVLASRTPSGTLRPAASDLTLYGILALAFDGTSKAWPISASRTLPSAPGLFRPDLRD